MKFVTFDGAITNPKSSLARGTWIEIPFLLIFWAISRKVVPRKRDVD